MKKIINIAVDGPSGAGKSTLCDKIAEKFGLIHLDTGALYRSVGAFVLSKGIDPGDCDEVTKSLDEIDLQVKFESGKQLMYVNGENYTDIIRRPEMSMAASKVSAHPSVRKFLLARQQDLAKEYSVILDGRDIGTVVLPDADIKLFITVDPKIRAERRYKEQVEKGFSPDFEKLYQEIIERDKADSTRKIAPLKKADDAILFENNGTIDDSIDALCRIIGEKLK